MACAGCKNNCSWNIIMPCKVCEMNNADAKPKGVCWCDLCGAYICKEHINDLGARAKAAAKTILQLLTGIQLPVAGKKLKKKSSSAKAIGDEEKINTDDPETTATA